MCEHNCKARTPTATKNRSNKTETQLQGANTNSNINRSNNAETQLQSASTNSSTNRSNKTETQMLGANTKSNENRNNKTETAHIFIRCHFGQLLFALVFALYIYPAILHRCSHLAFIPPVCIGVRTSLHSFSESRNRHGGRKFKTFSSHSAGYRPTDQEARIILRRRNRPRERNRSESPHPSTIWNVRRIDA